MGCRTTTTFFVQFSKDGADLAGGLGFSAPGPDGTDRHHRLSGPEHGVGGPHENKIGAVGHGLRCFVHDLHMGNITVGKGHQVHMVFPDEMDQPAFGIDGNPFWVCIP